MFLGSCFVLLYRNEKLHHATTTTDTLVTTTVQQENDFPKKTAPVPNQPSQPSQISPGTVVDVQQWLENGPKEPLEPRENHVKAELAPGTSATAEPIEPREIRINAELAPGEAASSAPLAPREINTEMPPR